MKALAVCKFLANSSANLMKLFLSNTTSLFSSHSVNSEVACNNNFLSNNFLINPAIPSISPKSIINTSAKSVIFLVGNSDDIATHKSAIPRTLATPRVDSTVSSTSTTFLTVNISFVLLKFLLNLLLNLATSRYHLH